MAKEIPWEIREQAEEMYITGGQTFDEVSAATGVSVSQLKRWSGEGGWTERKREYRKSFADIKRNTVILRKRLIEKALKSLDPQDVYAISSLESVAARMKNQDSAAAPVPVTDLKKISTPGDAVEALQEAVEHKVNLMLNRPDEIDLAGIKNMKQAIELLEKMQAKYRPGDEKSKAEGLSDAAAEEIKAKILGITKR